MACFRPPRLLSIGLSGLSAIMLSFACANGEDNDDNDAIEGPFAVAQASTPRNLDPTVTTAQLGPLVDGNTAFATDLYRLLGAEEGNLFLSPHSISLALAMAYAGAAGETAAQMAETLHFDLPPGNLHPAFNRLDMELQSRATIDTDDEADPFELSIANSIWAESTYTFLAPFLETLAVNYGAGARLVDFINDAEGARIAINDWVSNQTNERIPELVPPGVIDAMTRLVLTNTIFFKASWDTPFEEPLTEDGEFHRLAGDTVMTAMMHSAGTLTLPYAEAPGWQAIELPYAGEEVAMLIVLPDDGIFREFQAAFTEERLATVTSALQPEAVSVALPRFEFSSEFSLKEALTELGMPAAFEEGRADFSGMDGTRELLIQDVIHQAFVAVDEEGTEAAAATAVVVGVTSAPADPKVFEADRPFLFLIRDRVTGTVLFIGHVIDPTQ